MASSSSSLYPNSHTFPLALSLHSVHPHHLPLNLPLTFNFKTLKFAPNCSSSQATIQTDAQRNHRETIKIIPKVQRKKTSRKPKPSFYDQISEKWSQKPTISTNLPWNREEATLLKSEAEEDGGEWTVKDVSVAPELNFGWRRSSDDVPSQSPSSASVGGVSGSVTVTPWGRRPRKAQLDFERELEKCSEKQGRSVMGENLEGCVEDLAVEKSMKAEKEVGFDGEVDLSRRSSTFSPFSGNCVRFSCEDGAWTGGKLHAFDGDNAKLEASSEANYSSSRPWQTRDDLGDKKEGRLTKSNTELAEKTIPEHELKRLRNLALRMVERTKVGEAGITQSLVDTIHEKWKVDEVVKLKFEGSSAINMRRAHETLEIKTGGLVIWRSGSSVVLFRGINYKLDWVQSYNKQKSNDSEYSQTSVFPDSLRIPSSLSEEELMDVSEFKNLLDELGPPFEDWTGSNLKPVDADLLPGVIPGYKPPFRLLPYGMRLSLRNKEMTSFRRHARRMPPHFALGRNKELEGLAAAMVKLWEKSAIAKIAIKRGVLNTCNDKMAEDLKKLTGGTLLSRNKEYIVFYRGNDFLPPAVADALKEREKLTGMQHQEEEAQRDTSLLIDFNAKAFKQPLVAGTLAETVAAASHWGKQTSSEDLLKFMKDSAIARHASLVKYLENKLALAKRKLHKAEKALAKVQEYLQPSEIPSDLEMITDEERFLFRKIGLSMKPYLLLGRRGVFDGTIQNMHLHWKFRELVKIIVKGMSFAQVRHIAISLEAESGGVFVSIDRTTKGYAIIIYRGKNYQQPLLCRPRNLLTRRQALARSIELQRREALKHHISDLLERIELIQSELEDMKNLNDIDDKTLYSRLDDASDDNDSEEDEDEEAYLKVYDSSDDNSII